MNFLLIFIGGGIGSCLRHGLTQAVGRAAPTTWPWGTLTVNVLGGLTMGLLAGWLASKAGPGEGAQTARLFLATGLLGGFTTFSAFTLETYNLLERHAYGPALAYIGLSVTAALAAMALGLALTRHLLP